MNSKILNQSNLWWWLSIGAILIVWLLNLRLDVMEVDAAQYASIAREMHESGSFLEVFHRGKDYLDKPPLLFWMSAVSFEIFGINNFAYKLPAFLFLLLGIFSTYRFSLKFYGKKTAEIAALILASTQAIFLMTNDVRTDGLLTGCVIFSIWQIAEFLDSKRWKYLFGASVGIALGMMAKGPIALILPGFAFVGDWILKRDWKQFLRWEWLVAGLIIAVILLPMSYGLYTQFDLHPEKKVYGLDGPSGLRFFYWTQSFGRITGEIYWDNGAPFHFFMTTILWDFMPWVFFLFPAFFTKIKLLFSLRFRETEPQEWLTFFGFTFGFLALSLSKYKLPHYIFPLFPLAAVFTADWMVAFFEKNTKSARRFARFQFGFFHLFFLVLPLAVLLFFNLNQYWLPIVSILLFISYWQAFLKIKNLSQKVVLTTVIAALNIGLAMSIYFYPSLLNFHPSRKIAKSFLKSEIPNDRWFLHKKNSSTHAVEYYAKHILKTAKIDLSNLPVGTSLVLIPEKTKLALAQNPSIKTETISTFETYPITRLNLPFLKKNTRKNALRKLYLEKITIEN